MTVAGKRTHASNVKAWQAAQARAMSRYTDGLTPDVQYRGMRELYATGRISLREFEARVDVLLRCVL